MKWLTVAAFALACHHDAPPPAEPAGTPPLPPASGTPVGYLVDAAADLHLRDDQVAQLRDIDTSLAADLESIDAQTRAANRPSGADAAPAQPMGRHGGGRHGGGMGGGAMPSGGRSGGHHKRGGGSGSAVSPSGGAAASRLADQRAGEVREALKRAFSVLDADQQQRAKQVLAAHDVDVDADAAPAPPPSGSDDDPAPEP